MPEQVILIKEASQGARFEIAKHLASCGCRVFVTHSKGIDSTDLKKAAEELMDYLTILPLAIESETSMQIALELIANILREQSSRTEVYLSVLEPVRTYRITHEAPVTS